MIATSTPGGDWVKGLQTQVQTISLSLQAMMVLLVREREALLGRNEAQSLSNIAANKQAFVVQVSAVYEMLRSAMRQHLDPDMSLTECIAAVGKQNRGLARQLDELVQLTSKCQQANQHNGALISSGLVDCKRELGAYRLQ